MKTKEPKDWTIVMRCTNCKDSTSHKYINVFTREYECIKCGKRRFKSRRK